MKILAQDFYSQNTLKVAENLLGCFLVRKIKNNIFRFRIVETEAYKGPNDLASHASRGLTARNKIMFGNHGFIYIYLVYGMHYMLNIVTEEKNYPAAVLIRAVEPEKNNSLKTNGPARLTKVLKITKKFNGLPIFKKDYDFWIEEADKSKKNFKIIKTTRIGVDYAKEYKDKKWRFYIKDNDFISKK